MSARDQYNNRSNEGRGDRNDTRGNEGRGQGRAQPNKEDPVARAQQRREGEDAARHWESMGLYIWADHWRRWAISPVGTPRPPNYHAGIAHLGGASASDPRSKLYPGYNGEKGSLEAFMGQDHYQKWLNKDKRKADRQASPYSENDLLYDSDGKPVMENGKPVRILDKLRMQGVAEKIAQSNESSLCELGKATNEKGHPYLLIRKLKELRDAYPEFYKMGNDIM